MKKQEVSAWKITVHSLFIGMSGTAKMATFTVQVPLSTTVKDLIETFRKCPENRQPEKTTATGVSPFHPEAIGSYDHQLKTMKYENPNAKPNCSWNPDPETKTIQEAGLCDGAELSYFSGLSD